MDYFFSIVDEMVESTAYWNPPPLIIEFRSDNGFYVLRWKTSIGNV